MSNLTYYDDRSIPDEGPDDAKILFVGEAPGVDEHDKGRPFVGESGMLFTNCLARNGIQRESVRLANLCHYRPNHNKFDNLIGTPVLLQGVQDLYAYIESHKEHITVICPMGAWPLMFITGIRPRKKRDKTPSIKNWRGSILTYVNDPSIKVIPTYHPAAVLRERSLYPTFDLDIRRVIEDSETRERHLPIRKYVTNPTGLDLEEWTIRLCNADYLATDIENAKKSTHLLCVGFAPSPDVAVCINAENIEGRKSIARILEAHNKKVFHYGFHDIRVLQENGFTIAGAIQEGERRYHHDTYIGQHVLNPELPRTLEYLTSIYTREPYYKTEGRANIPDDTKEWSLKTVDRPALYIYNCKDCAVTAEIYEKQTPEINANPNFAETFDFEMSMIYVLDHMSSSGMLIDKERRQAIIKHLGDRWARLQMALDGLTGFQTNVKSPKLASILYDKDKVGLPPRRNRNGGLTTDEDAIVSLITYVKGHIATLKTESGKKGWEIKLAILKAILEIRGIRQLLSVYLLAKISSDGRLRSIYKPGTETGRLAAGKYIDGTGINSQTFPREVLEIDEALLVIGDLTSGSVDVKLPDTLETDEDDEDDEESEEEAA